MRAALRGAVDVWRIWDGPEQDADRRDPGAMWDLPARLYAVTRL
jgi:hypothetical protein